MCLPLLEEHRHWRATVEYHGSRGQQTVYLMDDGLMGGCYYWFIARYQGQWPWDAVRDFDPGATVRMIEAGKMRLVRGRWPESVLKMLAEPPHAAAPERAAESRGHLVSSDSPGGTVS